MYHIILHSFLEGGGLFCWEINVMMVADCLPASGLKCAQSTDYVALYGVLLATFEEYVALPLILLCCL